MSEKRKFDSRLNHLLTISGVSCQELAQRLNVTVPVVRRWLNGTSTPDVYQFQGLAKFFGLPCEWFLGGSIPTVEELAERLGLSEETVEGLLELAESAPDAVLDAVDDAIYSIVCAVTGAKEGAE